MTLNPTKSTAVVVLANLMDQNGTLNDETRGRLELGAQLARDHAADEVVFMGWDYRDDTDLAISDAMLAHAQKHGLFSGPRLRCNQGSRDTVGDAVLASLDYAQVRASKKLLIATSDYHVDRTQQIFGFVWANDFDVFGAQTPPLANRAESERRSIDAFRSTFRGIEKGDLPAILNRMADAHPFYNGSVFPLRPFDVDAHLRVLAT